MPSNPFFSSSLVALPSHLSPLLFCLYVSQLYQPTSPSKPSHSLALALYLSFFSSDAVALAILLYFSIFRKNFTHLQMFQILFKNTQIYVNPFKLYVIFSLPQPTCSVAELSFLFWDLEKITLNATSLLLPHLLNHTFNLELNQKKLYIKFMFHLS